MSRLANRPDAEIIALSLARAAEYRAGIIKTAGKPLDVGCSDPRCFADVGEACKHNTRRTNFVHKTRIWRSELAAALDTAIAAQNAGQIDEAQRYVQYLYHSQR